MCKHYFHIKLLKHTCWANIWSNLTFEGNFKLKSVFLGRYFLLTLSLGSLLLRNNSFHTWHLKYVFFKFLILNCIFRTLSFSLSLSLLPLTRHVSCNGEPLTSWNIRETLFLANSCEPNFMKTNFSLRAYLWIEFNYVQQWEVSKRFEWGWNPFLAFFNQQLSDLVELCFSQKV